jgi:hypothetical protein
MQRRVKIVPVQSINQSIIAFQIKSKKFSGHRERTPQQVSVVFGIPPTDTPHQFFDLREINLNKK